MIFPSNRVRIMVATKPVDFRKGHDGLAALVKNQVTKLRESGNSEVAFRVAVKDGKVAFTVRGMKESGE